MTVIISKSNEGPVVNMAAWFGTIVMVLGVCTRLWSKYSILRKWTIDDILIIITMVSLSPQSRNPQSVALITLMIVLGLYSDCHPVVDGCKWARSAFNNSK